MGNKKLILLSGIIIVSLLNYIRYVQYTEKLREDAIKLRRLYISYAINGKLHEKPKNKKDVEKVFSWQKETSGDKELDFNFLKYGYNVQYDSISNKSAIYCFGKNKKDDKLVNCNGYVDAFLVNRIRIVTLDFFNYYFNKSNDDIIMLKFYDSPSLHKSAHNSIKQEKTNTE